MTKAVDKPKPRPWWLRGEIVVPGLVVPIALFLIGPLLTQENDPTPVQRQNVDCGSANVIGSMNTGNIVGQANCEIQLALGEAIAGAAQQLNNSATCVEFFIQGPVSIANLQVVNANWTIYRNPEFNDQQVSDYLENERNRLTREVRDCSSTTLDTILIPSVILVPSNSEQGVMFSAPFDGIYSIQIVGGAYSTHSINDPIEYTDRWRTAIAVYVNRGIDWQPRPYGDTDTLNITYLEPRNADYTLGSLGNRSQSAAMNVGISSQSEEVDMRVGDYLVFVAIDDQGWYATNQGEVEVRLSLKPD